MIFECVNQTIGIVVECFSGQKGLEGFGTTGSRKDPFIMQGLCHLLSHVI